MDSVKREEMNKMKEIFGMSEDTMDAIFLPHSMESEENQEMNENFDPGAMVSASTIIQVLPKNEQMDAVKMNEMNEMKEMKEMNVMKEIWEINEDTMDAVSPLQTMEGEENPLMDAVKMKEISVMNFEIKEDGKNDISSSRPMEDAKNQKQMESVKMEEINKMKKINVMDVEMKGDAMDFVSSSEPIEDGQNQVSASPNELESVSANNVIDHPGVTAFSENENSQDDEPSIHFNDPSGQDRIDSDLAEREVSEPPISNELTENNNETLRHHYGLRPQTIAQTLSSDLAFRNSPQCKFCDNRFKSINNLIRHLENSCKGIRLNSNCRKSPRPKKSSMKRNKSQKREKVFLCIACNETFRRKKLFVDHAKLQHGERPYDCLYCIQEL